MKLFEVTYQSSEPYNWGILNDGMMVLGFHQTDEFGDPIMTYFADDMAERIAQLKAKGVVFAKEIPNEEGNISNTILKSPDGHEIFLFRGDL